MHIKNIILAMTALLLITSLPLYAEPDNQMSPSNSAVKSQTPTITEQGGNLVAAPSSDDKTPSRVAPPPATMPPPPPPPPSANTNTSTQELPEGVVLPEGYPSMPGTSSPNADAAPTSSNPSATGN